MLQSIAAVLAALALAALALRADAAARPALLGLALLALTLAAWWRQTARRWALGAAGERRVAQRLRRLQRRGWIVRHDVDRGRGNIDHLAAGPGGVFTIETKLTRCGDRELAQARAHAAWASRRLGVHVTPVLCIVQRRRPPKRIAGVWCVDLRRLPRVLRHCGNGPADLAAIAHRLP